MPVVVTRTMIKCAEKAKGELAGSAMLSSVVVLEAARARHAAPLRMAEGKGQSAPLSAANTH